MVGAFLSGTARALGFLGVALFLIGFQFGYGALVGVYAAVMAAIAIGFVYRLAPETRYRPLEEIRTYWEQGGRW